MKEYCHQDPVVMSNRETEETTLCWLPPATEAAIHKSNRNMKIQPAGAQKRRISSSCNNFFRSQPVSIAVPSRMGILNTRGARTQTPWRMKCRQLRAAQKQVLETDCSLLKQH